METKRKKMNCRDQAVTVNTDSWILQMFGREIAQAVIRNLPTINAGLEEERKKKCTK